MTEKPSGTSAATTAFCAHKLTGPGGHLWIDGNGKITAGNGTLDAPTPNAFSLVEIADCPGSTPTCRESCYVHGLKKHAPETHALYVHNSKEIRRILDLGKTDHRARFRWVMAMADYIASYCTGGFRWHVSGDVFSRDYAVFIAGVVQQSPKVDHWIYTRSFTQVDDRGFNVIAPLLTLPNLAVNISADKDNAADAIRFAYAHNLRLCYMTTQGELPINLRDGDVIFPDYNLRGGTDQGRAWFDALSPDYKSYVCPVDYHGKAENRRCGPCPRCLFPRPTIQ